MLGLQLMYVSKTGDMSQHVLLLLLTIRYFSSRRAELSPIAGYEQPDH